MPFDLKHLAGEKRKVTIYFTSGMGVGVCKVLAYLLECGRRQYAQYPAAPYVKCIPKGKRLPRVYVEGYKPYLVIVDGWDTPEPHGVYEGGEVVSDTADATVTRGRYSSFDPRWQSDFDARLSESGAKILADYRAKQEVCVDG